MSWVRSTISTEDEAWVNSMTEGSTTSTEVKDEAGVISMTGRFSSMQVELQEAVDRKSQCDSEEFFSEGKTFILEGKGNLKAVWISRGKELLPMREGVW